MANGSGNNIDFSTPSFNEALNLLVLLLATSAAAVTAAVAIAGGGVVLLLMYVSAFERMPGNAGRMEVLFSIILLYSSYIIFD